MTGLDFERMRVVAAFSFGACSPGLSEMVWFAMNAVPLRGRSRR